ncbi:hypothetical protein GJV51_01950 [Leuconostoc mesenteroides subsp. mesenteroides]|nr:hypothetical protein GJV51_01950 [Leuconostoc mesenteroides subsp. mesenteroides]
MITSLVIISFVILLSSHAISFVNKYLPNGTKSDYMLYIFLLFSAIYKQYTALIIFVGISTDYTNQIFTFFKDIIKFLVDILVSFSIIFSMLIVLSARSIISRNWLIKIDWIKEDQKHFYLQPNSVFAFFVLSIFCTLILTWLVYKILNYFFKSEWQSRTKYTISYHYPNKKYVLNDNDIFNRNTKNLKS